MYMFGAVLRLAIFIWLDDRRLIKGYMKWSHTGCRWIFLVYHQEKILKSGPPNI